MFNQRIAKFLMGNETGEFFPFFPGDFAGFGLVDHDPEPIIWRRHIERRAVTDPALNRYHVFALYQIKPDEPLGQETERATGKFLPVADRCDDIFTTVKLIGFRGNPKLMALGGGRANEQRQNQSGQVFHGYSLSYIIAP